MKNEKPTANCSLYLDKLRPKKNGKMAVKIKVTFLMKRKYYGTGIELTESEYLACFPSPTTRRTVEQKNTYDKMDESLGKAKKVIDSLPIFTFAHFEKKYLESRESYSTISSAFDKHIDDLMNAGKLGTAESYRSAKRSLDGFKKGLTFPDITPALLKKYEKKMRDDNRSYATIGIYLRCLRTIFNRQFTDHTMYPFGSGSGKYSIPTGANTKKALTIDDVARIFNYPAADGSTMQMAKDYWLFLYLANGMNMKDFCLLRWSDIKPGNVLEYQRAKSYERAKTDKTIKVSLKPESLDIISRHGQPSINPDGFIFPHLNMEMDEAAVRRTVKQLTKTVNKYLKRIAAEIGLNKDVTTYAARHSFATVLKRSGANISMISELLGHSNLKVTQNYLDSFEDDQIHDTTNVLTAGFKKAN